uniref:Beta-catenin-like protein 1 n=1 Tax=Parastrongyloides trichosuri TaxID=131310 RepID=A0A0N4ZTZ6_PARTI
MGSYGTGIDEIIKVYEPEAKKIKYNEKNQINVETATKDEILSALEADDSEVVALDESDVRRMFTLVEKNFLKNQELRIKYKDNPLKFLDSEIELNTSIQELNGIVTETHLYPVVVDIKGTEMLIQLLTHENIDIVITIIFLLQELTPNSEETCEDEKATNILLNSFIQNKLVEALLKQGFERLDENKEEESEAINNILTIIENILSFNPVFASNCVNEGLFLWMLKKVTTKNGDNNNVYYMAQLLAQLLQSSPDARKMIGNEFNGIEALLIKLSVYRKKDPSTNDELEFMENLFDCLCASFIYVPNRKIFVDDEGLQLMNLMLREKKLCRQGALKVLTYATTSEDGKYVCENFIKCCGLTTLLNLFMRTPPKKKRKDTNAEEHEEFVTSILDALLRYTNNDDRIKILERFCENNCEKIDRCVELFVNYQEKINKYDQRRKKALAQLGSDQMTEDQDQLNSKRLDNGLFTLQQVTLILSDICAYGSLECSRRVSKLFQMRFKNKKISQRVVPILEEYCEILGEESESERKRVSQLISKLSKVDKEIDS